VKPAASVAGPAIVRLASVPSTQAIAFDLAEAGAADGTVVLADHQTAGRGRRGRTWEDAPGASLLASVLMRPRLEPRRLPWLSYVAAVAVAEALQEAAGVEARLKWPNDVLAGGRKIAGILLEARMAVPRPGEPAAAVTVVGIGVNLAPASVPAALAARATCVREAAGRDADRDALLAAVLAALERWRARLERQGAEPVRRRWLALAEGLGRPVRVGGVSGVAVDLDADGALVVDGPGGRQRVVAGEVEG